MKSAREAAFVNNLRRSQHSIIIIIIIIHVISIIIMSLFYEDNLFSTNVISHMVLNEVNK